MISAPNICKFFQKKNFTRLVKPVAQETMDLLLPLQVHIISHFFDKIISQLPCD